MAERIVKGLRESRRERIADAKRKINVKGKNPDFEYRVVNDIENGQRIQQFLDLGWTIDTKTTAGDKQVNQGSKEGTPNQISVGLGTKAFVMKIPKEIYADDQAIKAEEIDRLEAGLKPSGTYGSIKFDKSEVKARK